MRKTRYTIAHNSTKILISIKISNQTLRNLHARVRILNKRLLFHNAEPFMPHKQALQRKYRNKSAIQCLFYRDYSYLRDK